MNKHYLRWLDFYLLICFCVACTRTFSHTRTRPSRPTRGASRPPSSLGSWPASPARSFYRSVTTFPPRRRRLSSRDRSSVCWTRSSRHPPPRNVPELPELQYCSSSGTVETFDPLLLLHPCSPITGDAARELLPPVMVDRGGEEEDEKKPPRAAPPRPCDYGARRSKANLTRQHKSTQWREACRQQLQDRVVPLVVARASGY